MSAPNALANLEVWFLTGSQHLYGPETLQQVAWQSAQIAGALEADSAVPVRIVWKPVLTQPDEIRRVMLAANDSDAVVGVIAWMHTFSPAKMWIAGLSALDKPLLHLHTQANVALPWADIDFDFMNLNQAAHGDREFGYIQTRLAVRRKTVVGHVSDPRVIEKVATWSRSPRATRPRPRRSSGSRSTPGASTTWPRRWPTSIRPTSTRLSPSTRTATTSRPNSRSERSAISRSATARPSN
jgi:L-arabinose isomerase